MAKSFTGTPNAPVAPTNAGTTDYVPVYQSDGTVQWEAQAGGVGLTVTGTPTNGDTVGWNPNGGASGQWEPRNPGAGVFDVTGYGASGRGETTTTGTASGGSTTLTLASASTFAKGQGIAVLGAGATHAVSAPAAPLIGSATDNGQTYTYSLYSLTGDGGWSTASSTGTSTDAVAAACGPTTISAATPVYICWATVSGAEGYGICGRGGSDRFTVNTLNGAPNARRITFGADPNFTIADIGTTVTQAITGHTGILLSFSNAGRVAYVKPTLFGTDSFSGTANSTTATSGRGGTSNAAAGNAHYWQDTGDASSLAHTIAAGVESGGATQPSHGRRASTQYFPGQRFLHPMSNVGVQYIVTKVTPTASNYATTSATATGSVSYTSTVGVETADGDIYVMPMPAFWPVAEPVSAKPNAHLTTIAAISGTTVTMAAATGNAVTSQVVLHNDWKAISDARTAQTAANVKANELYFPAGNYNIITGDSEVDTWSQWDNPVAAANILFGGTNELARSWRFSDAASTYWMPLSHRASHTDSGDKDTFWNSLGFNQPRWTGGRFIYSPAAEPVIIALDAWNRVQLFSDYSSGATQFSQGVEFRGAEFWGVPRFADTGAQNGYGRAHKLIGCIVKWGGAGHDSMCYGSWSEICYNRFFGDLSFGSDVCYTNDQGAPDTVNDRFLFHGNKIFRSRINGVRLRMDGCTLSDNDWTDSTGAIVYMEGYQATLSNCTAKNGGGFLLTGLVTASNFNLIDAQLQVTGGTVSVVGGAALFTTAADTYFSSGQPVVAVSGGTSVVIDGMVVANNETSGAVHGVNVSGGTRVGLDGLNVTTGSGYGLNVTSSFAGRLMVDGGYYRAGSLGEGHYLCQNAGAVCQYDGVTFEAGASASSLYSSGGTTIIKNCLSYCELETGGPRVELWNNRFTGTTAGGFGVGTYCVAVDNLFDASTAPTMTTPSLTYTRGNQVNSSAVANRTLPIGTSNDLLLSVCDDQCITPNASNSTIGGIAAMADGTSKRIFNVHASASLILDDDGLGSSAANRFAFAALTIPAAGCVVLMYHSASSLWRLVSKNF